MFSAQTGISRFLEVNRKYGWIYDKSENVSPGSKDMLNFTHLLVEAESEQDPRLAYYKQSHRIQSFIRAFNGVYFSPANFPLLKIKTIPKVFILKRNNLKK